MAIRLDAETVDKQGFPVVSWEEDRNLFAPEGHGRARVACFIKPDKEGVLHFVCVGSVRHGRFEEARRWDMLRTFERATAEHLYYSGGDRAALDWLGSRSKSGAGRVLMADGAHVMLANFADVQVSAPMHLNCADCAPVEMVPLHDRLHREFIAKRDELVSNLCGTDAVWSKDKPEFVPHVPNISARGRTVRGWVYDLLGAATVAGLIGSAIYLFIIR
jgi:hypothetical protein